MHRLGAWILLGLAIVVSGKDCVWDKAKSFPEHTPLMVGSDNKLILPTVEGDKTVVRVSSGTKMTVACPGRAVGTVKGDKTWVKAKCISNTMLLVNGKRYSLKRLGCTGKLKPSIKKGLGKCANGLGELSAIGYNDVGGSFFEVLRVCFDPGNQTTLYTEHVIRGQHIEAKDINPSRPSFKSDIGFFTVSMSSIYSKSSQKALMIKLLGSEDLANTIIDSSSQFYFARGHMTPDADFVTEAEQDATYYYINALPQWQAFNNGNWKQLEFATRSLAEDVRLDLRVYSGGWGVLQLPDVNNNLVKIYLGLTTNKTVVPAPAVTWKVVHDEKNELAAAIIGVNNPHLTTAPTPICSGSCDDLGWINFDVDDLNDGFTYCCSVADLRSIVPYVPDLGNVTLLSTVGCPV